MQDLKVLNICGVDCYEKAGTAYLKLETVARGLGFTTTQTVKGTEYTNVRWGRVDEYLEEIGFATSGKRPEYIPENIFYRLAMKAKNETAEKFQAKVADEIIPSIRKTGGYIEGQETLSDDELLEKAVMVAQRRIAERDKVIKQQKEQIAEQRPLVDFAVHVSQSKDTIDMDEMAKIARDEHIDIGRNRLVKWLKDRKILKDNRTPYQTFIDRGYFDVVEVKKETTYGTRVFPKTVVTGKGQIWVIEKLRAEYC